MTKVGQNRDFHTGFGHVISGRRRTSEVGPRRLRFAGFAEIGPGIVTLTLTGECVSEKRGWVHEPSIISEESIKVGEVKAREFGIKDLHIPPRRKIVMYDITCSWVIRRSFG